MIGMWAIDPVAIAATMAAAKAANAAALKPPAQCGWCTAHFTMAHCICTEICDYRECWALGPTARWCGLPGTVHYDHPVPVFT